MWPWWNGLEIRLQVEFIRFTWKAASTLNPCDKRQHWQSVFLFVFQCWDSLWCSYDTSGVEVEPIRLRWFVVLRLEQPDSPWSHGSPGFCSSVDLLSSALLLKCVARSGRRRGCFCHLLPMGGTTCATLFTGLLLLVKVSWLNATKKTFSEKLCVHRLPSIQLSLFRLSLQREVMNLELWWDVCPDQMGHLLKRTAIWLQATLRWAGWRWHPVPVDPWVGLEEFCAPI